MKPKNIFPGEWESIFHGDGIEFSEIKPYEPGDDLRDLNLDALVQSGDEEIVLRIVERQMKIYLWVDFSGSMRRYPEMFFSQKPTIRNIAISLLLFSACNTYSPIGFLAFNNRIKKIFPARVGESHCWEVLNWLIDQDKKQLFPAGDVQNSLKDLTDRTLPKSLVFFISDFEHSLYDRNFTDVIFPLLKKFDFIPVIIQDPIEKNVILKRPVRLSLRDSESSKRTDFYLTPQNLKEIQQVSSKRFQLIIKTFRDIGVHPIILDSSTVDDCYNVFSGYFQARRRFVR